MPDQKIFCNTPWYEIHIYWDGSLGICCQESHKIYNTDERYHVSTTTISEWFDSLPVRRMRSQILSDKPLSACSSCYREESADGYSRRMRSNQKSAIFTSQAFDHSFQQSPGHKHFWFSQQNDGHTKLMPVDLHIDLGNFCNLACKMCSPKASSTIASQHVKWGIESSRRFLGTDWTRDTTVWNRVLDQLTDIPNLKNIHLMGGETLLTDRMEHMIDHFIKRKRFDCSFSFVTNGTVYKPDLMSKLARFSRVGIEVSMETMTDHNQYVRQGTNNDLVRRNIDLFRSWSRDSITVTLRPTISALTIGNVHTLFDYARQEHLLMKSLICNSPAFLDPGILPDQVKALYRTRLQMCLDRLPTATAKDYNFSDPNNVVFVLKDIINMTINLLHKSQPVGSDDRLREMVAHCERWDSAYGLDARSLYPELSELFDRFGYHV